MTSTLVKIHESANTPSSWIELALIFGGAFVVIGIIFIVYSSKQIN